MQLAGAATSSRFRHCRKAKSLCNQGRDGDRQENERNEWYDLGYQGAKAKAPPCRNSTQQTPLPQQSSLSAREEDHWEVEEERRRRRIALENLAKGMLRYLDYSNDVKLVWCIFICHPHLTSISCCSAVWAQACGLERKQVLSLSCILGSFGVLDRFLLLLVSWWEQYHDTATLGTDYPDLRNRDSFCSCVLVNILQYHDTVQDSETEDPQLVAEPGVGRNQGKTL